MSAFLTTLFKTDHFEKQSEVEQARLLYGIAGIIFVASLLISFLLPIQNGVPIFVDLLRTGAVLPLLSLLLTLVVSISAIFFVREKQVEAAAWLIYTLLIFRIFATTQSQIDNGIMYITVAGTIMLTGLFFNLQNALIASGGTIIAFLISYLLKVRVVDQGLPVSSLAGFIILSGIIYLFIRARTASRVEGEVLESEQRFKLAEINSQIASQASERVPLDDALETTLRLILENYPQIYHAQVFLIDDDGVQARLRASTGTTGKHLLEQGHSLAVGSLSVIGQTTFKNEPVIAVAGDSNSLHRQNELLPATRVEAAFPLRVSNRVIGALDLQSRENLKLSDYDLLSFQSLANSLSLAIDNIRQFQEAQERIEENQRLTEQTRTALREVERLNQRLIGRAWSEYLNTRGSQLGLNIDMTTMDIIQATDWTQTLAHAMQNNSIVQDGQIIALPLKVRGEVVGAMEFELDEDGQFSPEDLDLLQEVSERFGLAAENTRLLEQSLRIAQRETLINEISSRLQSATNVEATLTEAARSLSETLKAQRVSIRLGNPEDSLATGNGRSKSS